MIVSLSVIIRFDSNYNAWYKNGKQLIRPWGRERRSDLYYMLMESQRINQKLW